jgi:superfamily II DNA/RNA helicase
VLDGYRTLLEHALERYGTLGPGNRQIVLDSIQVDRGLIFSRVSNPMPGATVSELIDELHLAEKLREILDEQFADNPFYEHQERAIRAIIRGQQNDTVAVPHTVVATGTGSGKTESFLVPVLHDCLTRTDDGIKALLIYPMNALANDQLGRIAKWTRGTDVTFGTYVGSTPHSEGDVEEGSVDDLRRHDGHLITRQEMRDNPPDILLTNYIMLDYMLTREREAHMFEQSADSLNYLVLDEIHTYRGTKAIHLMHLLRRLEHRMKRDPVKIATSATLLPSDDEQQDAYMKVQAGDDPEELLRSFIQPLLGIDDFNYIALDSHAEDGDAEKSNGSHPSQNGVPPDELLDAGPHLDWLLTTDKSAQANRLEALTGVTIPAPRALDIRIHNLYEHLNNDPFVEAIRRAMGKRARSFQELVKILRETYDLDPAHDAGAITKAYLSAIAYLNHRMSDDDASKEPLLDFRMHLFLRDIDGYLKRCLRCDQFHAGGQDICPECGHPLFLVHRDNVSTCIARVVDGNLTYDLRPTTNEKESFHVLLRKVDGESEVDDPAILSIDALDFQNETADIAYDADGRFRLEWLDAKDAQEIREQHAVPLEDPNKDYDYLSRLARALLTYDSPNVEDRGNGKVLGFVDSREHVSRYGMGLRDEFADTFLRARLQQEASADLSLLNAAALVHRWTREEADGQEQELFNEAPIWLGRLIAQMPAAEQDEYLSLDDGLGSRLSDMPNSDLAHEILERAFLKNRLIDRGSSDPRRITEDERASAYYGFYVEHAEGPPEDTEFIRLHKHAAVRRNGVYLQKNGNSGHPNYSGYAITPDGRSFRGLIEEYGLEHVQQTIKELANRGVLCKRDVPKSESEHYYLRPEWVRLHPDHLLPDPTQEGVSTFGLPTDPSDIAFRTADSHSSERKANDRVRIENDFNGGALDVLMATPTLEMGVDIGDLSTVLMMGVPPMPSNYAQRAGRAGRKKNQQALIVTLCASHRPHDMFYFMHPSGMVNGYITPPSFNKDAPAVAEKHLNAWMLEGYSGERETLDRYRSRLDHYVEDKRHEAIRLFGDIEGFDVQAYLENQFQEALNDVFHAIEDKRSVQQALYKTGFFPDYTFRKDQIPLIRRDDLVQASDDSPDTLQDLSLSDRSPELAYYKFAPGRTVYIGGRVYNIMSGGASDEGAYETIEIGEQGARSYSYFVADPEERFASRYTLRQVYDREEMFADDDPENHPPHITVLPTDDAASPITIAYHPACTIGFRNDGLLEYGETRPFEEFHDDGTTTPFSVGYKFERKALRISIDGAVCRNPSVEISLAFALDRAIQGAFRLDEGEMRMLVHPKGSEKTKNLVATPVDDEKRPYRHILLYDHSGNDNVPFEDIYAAMTDPERLSEIRSIIHACDCDNGCYQCMRSFSTQYHAEVVRKADALDVLGYLAEGTSWSSAPQEPERETAAPDLTLTLSLSGETFTLVTDASEERYQNAYTTGSDDFNPTAFDLISEAILQEWTPGMDHLLVKSPQQSIVNAINDHAVDKGEREFSRLLFTMLRFRSVGAEKI